MQDIHAVGGAADGGGGGGGRFLGVGDRRLRPHNHPNHLQALKCPRCDSLNTKFCYYNNYNLSQPRYFCKNCRRYWTKGGVLRNVPVGGGCRKAKRSKPKISSGEAPRETKSNNQSSSSDGSSLTAATMPSSEGSAPINTTPSSSVIYTFPDAGFFNVDPEPINPNLDHRPTDGQIFPTDIGNFTGGLMSAEEEMMGFGMTTSYGQVQEEVKTSGAEDLSSGMGTSSHHVDQFKMQQDMTGTITNDGLTTLDWDNGTDGCGGDEMLFDLTASADPAYWNRSQWIDNDHSLNYLP